MHVIVRSVDVGRVGVCMISLEDFDIKCLLVGLREPIHLCAYVREERGTGRVWDQNFRSDISVVIHV